MRLVNPWLRRETTGVLLDDVEWCGVDGVLDETNAVLRI